MTQIENYKFESAHDKTLSGIHRLSIGHAPVLLAGWVKRHEGYLMIRLLPRTGWRFIDEFFRAATCQDCVSAYCRYRYIMQIFISCFYILSLLGKDVAKGRGAYVVLRVCVSHAGRSRH